MGVTGLLPQLKDIQENVSLEKFRGKRVAIDSYAWLHRAVFSCSWDLAQDLPTDKYILYFQRRIKMLEHFGVEPYFVFDGDDFNNKKDTEEERSKNRINNKNKGLECLENGDKKNASLYFSKCIDVTPEMAKSVIEYLKKREIKYIVAPYEADPQLVYLENLNLVDAIISEDSDLLIFGAKILLTKLNEFGDCIEINRDNFKKCKNFPFGLLNQDQLRMMACLSGCDYTNGISNIGIIKALKLVRRLSNMKRCLLNLRLEGKNSIPKDFELEYEKANLSFQFQRVFNPIENEIKTLNEPNDIDLNNPLFQECIGSLLDNEIHYKISIGDLNPITKEKLIARDEFIEKNIILTQFNKTRSIESYFVKSVNNVNNLKNIKNVKNVKTVKKPAIRSMSTTIMDSIIKKQIESPTSKRRKLFNSESKGTTSIYFRSKTEPTTTATTTNENIIDMMNSSDYDLTDVDEEEKEKTEEKTEENNKYEKQEKQEKVNLYERFAHKPLQTITNNPFNT